MRKTKRILSLALAAVLIFSMGTMTAFAEEPDEPEFTVSVASGTTTSDGGNYNTPVDDALPFSISWSDFDTTNMFGALSLVLESGPASATVDIYNDYSSQYEDRNLPVGKENSEMLVDASGELHFRAVFQTAGTYTFTARLDSNAIDTTSNQILGSTTFTIEAKTDTSTLDGLIASAQQLYDSTKESADGSDVYTDVRWAPAADRAKFADAIQDARTAAEKATTSAELETAYNTLEAAITAYEGALKWGLATRPEPSAPSQSSSSSSSSRKPERLLAGWDSIVSRALHADPEDTLSFDMTGEKYVPATLIEALQESGAALELEYRGTVYTVTGDSVEVDSGRIYWPAADFLDLLRDAPAAAEEAPAADGDDVSAANPDTGAHDGVGLAAALAALSLAAAGAVSLRRR